MALDVDRTLLYERIDGRVEKMVEAGLVEEVSGLLEAGFRDGLTARQAIGYKEIVSYLDGDMSLDEAVAQIKQATRRGYVAIPKSYGYMPTRALLIHLYDVR